MPAEPANTLLEGLNTQQTQAVTHTDGPLLIVAGAGTGKTTVVTRRIAHLIMSGHAASNEILALTFTEKAAGEMEERVDALVPYGTHDLWISTFHAFGERILQDHAIDIGLPTDCKLLSDTEQTVLLREHIDNFDLDYYRPKGNPTKFVQALISHFSRLKDEDITPAEYMAHAEQLQKDTDSEFAKKKKGLSEEEQAQVDEARRVMEVAKAYVQYQQLLRSKNALDFGDLIVECMHLFKERPAILQNYRKQFKYILVDEFQDTNFAQYALIKMLATPRNNLTVVADDDQAIYSFRGASMSNILIFKKDFPKSTEISLTENYRSAQNILDLAYDFIQHNNPNRLEETLKINKHLHAQTTAEGVISHLHAQTVEGEAKLVTDTILELKNAHPVLRWSDFAILVRANDQANIFIPYLERARVPYQFLASQGLFAKSVIIDIISFLKLLDNYHESRALYRVLSYQLWNIPPEDLMRMLNFGYKNGHSLFETCRMVRAVPQLADTTYKTVESILALVEKISIEARTQTAGEVLLRFLDSSGYLQWITKHTTQKATEYTLYLNQFYKYVEAFERANDERSVRNFVQELVLIMEAGESGRLKPDFDEGPESVKIMTVHAAKGLEFEYVFIVNMVDKRFPSIGRKEAIAVPSELVKDVVPEGDWHLEEERRLFYVALTRAKTGVFLTSAEDYGGARKKKPSRFLIETGFTETIPQHTGNVLLTEGVAPGEDGTPDPAVKHVPKTFSFTQLKSFETCPWQYRFAFLLRVPVPGKPSFSFGKTMHSTLYEFFRRIKESRDMSQGGLFDQPGAHDAAKQTGQHPTLEQLLTIYEEKWIGQWYPSKRLRDDYYNKGKEALKRFYELHSSQWPNVVLLEKNFQLRVGKYSLKGAIDRVDQTPDGIEVIDYKTGNFPKTGKKDAQQLALYAMALKEVFKMEPTKLTYYYIEDNKPLSVDVDGEEVQKVSEWALDLIQKILEGRFLPNPGQHCGFCDYRDICEYRAK